jgi:hypothetical protein
VNVTTEQRDNTSSSNYRKRLRDIVGNGTPNTCQIQICFNRHMDAYRGQVGSLFGRSRVQIFV